MGDVTDDLIEEGLYALYAHGQYQCDLGCPICNPMEGEATPGPWPEFVYSMGEQWDKNRRLVESLRNSAPALIAAAKRWVAYCGNPNADAVKQIVQAERDMLHSKIKAETSVLEAENARLRELVREGLAFLRPGLHVGTVESDFDAWLARAEKEVGK